jgi:hypothetical protein
VALTYFTGGVRRAWPRRRGPECDARGRHQRQQQRLIVGPVTAADELQVVADAAASAERDPADLAPRSDLDAPIRPQKRTAEPVVVSVHHCETSARQRGARVVAQRRLGLVGQPELEIPAEVSRANAPRRVTPSRRCGTDAHQKPTQSLRPACRPARTQHLGEYAGLTVRRAVAWVSIGHSRVRSHAPAVHQCPSARCHLALGNPRVRIAGPKRQTSFTSTAMVARTQGPPGRCTVGGRYQPLRARSPWRRAPGRSDTLRPRYPCPCGRRPNNHPPGPVEIAPAWGVVGFVRGESDPRQVT